MSRGAQGRDLRGRRGAEKPQGGPERLFVAVPLPGHVLERVQEFQQTLPDISGLRRLGPEQMHLTLAFIGEVGSEARSSAEQVIDDVPEHMGGAAHLGRAILLPSPRRARVVALAVDDEDGVLHNLYEHVMAGLEDREVMQREKRPFRPHVTVARLKERARMQPELEGVSVRYPVESVRLYKSRLRPQGAEYTVLAQRELSTGARSQTNAEEE